MSYLNLIGTPYADVKDTVTEQLAAAKTGTSALQSAYIASFQASYPLSFRGPKEGDVSSKRPGATEVVFGAFPTYKHWNNGDDTAGVKFQIEEALNRKYEEAEAHINAVLYGYPIAVDMCQALLQQASKAWEWLSDQIDKFYSRLRNTICSGSKSCPPEMEQMIFGVVAGSVKAFFDETRKVRVRASSAHLKPASQRTGLYLYATVQELATIDDFRKVGFQRHEKIYHRVVMYLLDTYASKDAIKAITDAFAKRLTEVETQQRSTSSAVGNIQLDLKKFKK